MNLSNGRMFFLKGPFFGPITARVEREEGGSGTASNAGGFDRRSSFDVLTATGAKISHVLKHSPAR
jgi:hypothetical protein